MTDPVANCAVLYNPSLAELFGDQARAVANALGGVPCLPTTDLLRKRDEQIDFRRCVYFDKDPIPALRLEALGVRLYNPIGAIEACDDKRRTCELLRRDLPIPETVCAPLLFRDGSEFDEIREREFRESVADRLGFPMIAKEAFGSLGKQVRKINTPRELDEIREEWKFRPHLFQRFIASSQGRDLRVYVVGNHAVASMIRHNPNDFRSNIGSGGKGTKADPPSGFAEVAQSATALLGLDFAGVDLLFGKDGTPWICEVNSNALFRELNAVCGVTVENEIADRIRTDASHAEKPTDFSDLFRF